MWQCVLLQVSGGSTHVAAVFVGHRFVLSVPVVQSSFVGCAQVYQCLVKVIIQQAVVGSFLKLVLAHNLQDLSKGGRHRAANFGWRSVFFNFLCKKASQSCLILSTFGTVGKCFYPFACFSPPESDRLVPAKEVLLCRGRPSCREAPPNRPDD